MEIYTGKHNGIKYVRITNVSHGDMHIVVPVMMLQGMSEKDAKDKFRIVVDGEDISCVTPTGVNLQCSST